MAGVTTDEATREHEQEIDLLGDAGANPARLDPGITGVGPTGGGKAVPDPEVFENQGALGDEDTLADDMNTSQADGDIPEDEETRTPPSGYVLETDDSDLPIGGVPTGGLPTGGTIGGIPTSDI